MAWAWGRILPSTGHPWHVVNWNQWLSPEQPQMRWKVLRRLLTICFHAPPSRPTGPSPMAVPDNADWQWPPVLPTHLGQVAEKSGAHRASSHATVRERISSWKHICSLTTIHLWHTHHCRIPFSQGWKAVTFRTGMRWSCVAHKGTINPACKDSNYKV